MVTVPDFFRMAEVTMAASRADVLPAIAFHQLQDVSNLHELEACGEG